MALAVFFPQKDTKEAMTTTYFHGFVATGRASASGGRLCRVRNPRVTVFSKDAQDALRAKGVAARLGRDAAMGPLDCLVQGPSGQVYAHTLERHPRTRKPQAAPSFSTDAEGQLSPTAYQRTLAEMLGPARRLRERRFLVYWKMGSGKTFATLHALRDCASLVVVCPLTLIRSAWLPALGAVKAPDMAAEQTVDIMGPDEAKGQPAAFYKNKVVVVDEVHLLRNSTALMQTLFRSLRGAAAVVGLSGTPLVNDVSEVDYLFELLAPPQGPRDEDQAAWARAMVGQGKVAPIAKALAAAAQGRVSYHGTVRGLPTIEAETVTVPMTPYQTLRYLCGLQASFRVGGVTFASCGGKNSYRAFEKQAANFIADGDGREHCPKIDACVAHVLRRAAAGEARQAVYCHFLEHQLRPLVARLEASGKVQALVVQGDTDLEARRRTIAGYNRKGGGLPKVLVYTDAANLGMSLKATGTLHVLDVPDNRPTYLQVIHRGARKGSHARGEQLRVLVYLAAFPPAAAKAATEATKLLALFAAHMRVEPKQLGITAKALVTALDEAKARIGGQTVDEAKWAAMEAKSDSIQPLLKALQRSAYRGAKKQM